MAAKPIPDTYPTITVYLCVAGAAKALDFYAAAFGAVEQFRLNGPGGAIVHAETKIRDAVFMLSDENPEWGYKGPHLLGGTPAGLLIYVENADAAIEKAVAAGAKVVKPIQDWFYGDRSGTVEDPFGHKWTLATHLEDVPPEEMNRRMEEEMKKMGM